MNVHAPSEPMSPEALEGALRAIRYARERNVPFLGTCAGFQHAVLEYARNVVDWRDAAHAELQPHAERAVIAPLSCSLVEVSGAVRLEPQSRLARAYGTQEIAESYHCRYGINPAFLNRLTSGNLEVAAHDRAGEVRALELSDHPFFVATLFQPERAALKGVTPPLVRAFLTACATI